MGTELSQPSCFAVFVIGTKHAASYLGLTEGSSNMATDDLLVIFFLDSQFEASLSCADHYEEL